MTEWKGLDSAGVEFLWDQSLILGTLEIFDANEPFSHSNPESPIYSDLAEQFSEVTWANNRHDDSFRPIFRRANPLKKLGLIDGDANHAIVSQLGKELLAGDTTIQNIFQMTLKSFIEDNGERSFAIMCAAGIHLADHIFTLTDIEFAVSQIGIQFDQLSNKIKQVRNIGTRFGAKSRRPRILRAFMNALVSAGAFSLVKNGWVLKEPSIAHEIVGSALILEPGIFHVDGSQVLNISISRSTDNYPVSEVSTGQRHRPSISSSAFSKIDSSQRAMLLERAHSEHEQLIELASAEIRKSGGIPLEGTLSFDVGCTTPLSMLVEAKHITQKNTVSQLRKAISQLPEYRWRHSDKFDENTIQIIALSNDPREFIPNDYFDFVEKDRKLPIIWRREDQLVDRHGKYFREYLAPQA